MPAIGEILNKKNAEEGIRQCLKTLGFKRCAKQMNCNWGKSLARKAEEDIVYRHKHAFCGIDHKLQEIKNKQTWVLM